MQYTTKQTTEFLLLALTGRLTFEDHRPFAEIIAEIGRAGDRHVILDASAVEYVDSSGFGMLIVAHETAHKAGGAFRIRNASPQFKALADRIHISQIIPMDCPTEP